MALKPYKVILGFALFVMIGMLPCFPLLNNTNGGVMLWAYSLVLSAFVLSAVWGGLGTQTYLRRTLLGSITIWGIFLGALGSIFLLQFDSTTSIDFPAAIIGLALVTMTVGGQIPFLLLNWLAGWHFSSERNSDKPSLSIQSMFTIVFVFAIAFASSQLAKQRILDAELARYVVGEETYVVDPGSAQGNGAVRGSSMKMVEVTAANIEELRRNAIKENQIESALLASLYAIVAGVLAIPILWFVFRRSYRASFIYSLLYVLGLGLAFYAAFRFLNSGFGLGAPTTREQVWFFCSIGMMALLIWGPLALLKRSGLILKTNWSGTNSKKSQLSDAGRQADSSKAQLSTK